MTPAELGAHFDRFTRTAFRLECLQHYGGEEDRQQAFGAGLPLPERSVRTSPWLARIAVTTATQGKRWQRVRVVEEPLTEYTRYELASYVESQAAGEEIRIARREAVPVTAMRGDFWLFDPGTPEAFALILDYAPGGKFMNAELVTEPEMLEYCAAERDLALRSSVPLNEYLAGKAVRAA